MLEGAEAVGLPHYNSTASSKIEHYYPSACRASVANKALKVDIDDVV